MLFRSIKALQEFRKTLDETFAVDLTAGAYVIAGNYRLNHKKFAPENILNDNADTYWATDDSVLSSDLIIQLSEEKQFDRIIIQEPIKFGQRISAFEIEIMDNNSWQSVFQGTTIGYKRLIRIPAVKTSQVRLRILRANNTIAISKFGLFKSSENE